MQPSNVRSILVENKTLSSTHLDREVQVDFFLPHPLGPEDSCSLLLINDGQNMKELGLESILEELYNENQIENVLCAAIYAGPDRKMEYGTAGVPDYKGRGAKAAAYSNFIFDELLPFIRRDKQMPVFREKMFAGFSLGGLSALDIVWQYPYEFTRVGVFSGSFWWRSKGLTDGYDESKDRIMHELIKEGHYAPWLRFFFETGTQDETMDRNNNGVIDSIDDTLSLIAELGKKGYDPSHEIFYLELKDGHHDVATWSRAMPVFLKWALGKD